MSEIVEEKQDITDFFTPLLHEDIEEKIKINKDNHGYDLIEFKMLLEHELHMIQRHKLSSMYYGSKIGLATFIQEQNLREQISYVNNKIMRETWQYIQRQL